MSRYMLHARASRREFLTLVAGQTAIVLLAGCKPPATSTPKPTSAPAQASAVPPSVAPTPLPPTAAPKKPVKVEGVAFGWWEGYTGKEADEWIEQYTKEKGEPPKEEDVPVFDKYAFWNAINAKLKEEKPEYDVSWELLEWKDGRAKMEVRFAAGDPADLVVWSIVDCMRYALLDALVDVKPALEDRLAEFDPNFLTILNGEYIQVPFQGFVHAWRLNRVLFRQAGVADLLPSEKTGWMWDHATFLEATKAITKGSGANASWGFAGWGDWNMFYPVSFSYGGSAWAEDGKTFILGDDEKGLKGAQFLIDMVKKESIAPPENVSSAVEDSIDTWYVEGRLGISDVGTYAKYDWIKEQIALGKVDPAKVEYDVVVPPADVENGVKPQCYSSTTGACVFKRPEEERTQGAFEWLRVVLRPEYAVILKQSNWPIRKSAETEEDLQPARVAYRQVVGQFASRQLKMPYWVAVRPIMDPVWEALIAEAGNPVDILRQAKADIAAFIAKEEQRLHG